MDVIKDNIPIINYIIILDQSYFKIYVMSKATL